MNVTRRQFLGGCALTLGGLQVFGSAHAQNNTNRVFVHVFLRGGFDALNLVCPYQGDVRSAYETLKGENAISTAKISPLQGDWGLYIERSDVTTSLSQFKQQLWDSGRLAIVHACGLPPDQTSRSHTQARDRVKLGVTVDTCSGEKNLADTGWLARYLHEIDPATTLPAMSIGHHVDDTLLGFDKAMSVSGVVSTQRDFLPLNSNRSPFKSSFNTLLGKVYEGNDLLAASMQSALKLVNNRARLQNNDIPRSSIGDFDRLAQLIRTPALGIRMATLEVGGWDSHTASPVRSPSYRNRLKQLADAINKFDANMVSHNQPYTMVVHTEFGRTLKERPRRVFGRLKNYSGTDHGSGSLMMVIGDGVNGKQFYGDVPTNKVLVENYEIPATTDYRKVIREILGKQFGANTGQLENIFPGFSDNTVLGVTRGNIANGRSNIAATTTDCEKPNTLFFDSFE